MFERLIQTGAINRVKNIVAELHPSKSTKDRMLGIMKFSPMVGLISLAPANLRDGWDWNKGRLLSQSSEEIACSYSFTLGERNKFVCTRCFLVTNKGKCCRRPTENTEEGKAKGLG